MSETIIRVNKQGRVVIPATLRQQLGIIPGTQLVARLEGERIVLEKPDDVFKRLRATFNSSTSLVDELIADRRAEAVSE
jgi:AbrB family looped-hinge helix DNA binding protein